MTGRAENPPGVAKGRLKSAKWLVLRRVVQLGILGLFALGPFGGIWILKGTLASSVFLGTIPLMDPYVAFQALLAGHVVARDAAIGTAVIAVFYLIVGGRAYCSWVCPVNLFTDLAAWLHGRGVSRPASRFPPSARYWLLAGTLTVSTITATIAWEWVNPVTILQRGLLFGMGLAWVVVPAVLALDLFVVRRGWCGHICPVGAFYSLLAVPALVRVSAVRRQRCNDCMACFAVCPEPQVIRPALKGSGERSPVILSPNCVNCGRCIDVCEKDVFRFSTRFSTMTEDAS